MDISKPLIKILSLVLFNFSFSTIALASGGHGIREITNVEWETGTQINCNGKGIEYQIESANSWSVLKRVVVACLNKSNKNNADWVIIGGFDIVLDRIVDLSDESLFKKLERFYPELDGQGNKPNLYSFTRFIIGSNCTLVGQSWDSSWNCESYSDVIRNNVLKTYGKNTLEFRSGIGDNWPSTQFKGINRDIYIASWVDILDIAQFETCRSTLLQSQEHINKVRDTENFAYINIDNYESYYRYYPQGRNFILFIGLDGEGENDILNSPKFMTAIATQIINNCHSVGIVSFLSGDILSEANNQYYAEGSISYGLLDVSIKEFQCNDFKYKEKLNWGYVECPL